MTAGINVTISPGTGGPGNSGGSIELRVSGLLDAAGNLTFGNGVSASQDAIITVAHGGSLVVGVNLTAQNHAVMNILAGGTVNDQNGNVQFNGPNDSLSIAGTLLDGVQGGMVTFQFNPGGKSPNSLTILGGGRLDVAGQVQVNGNGPPPPATTNVTISGTLVTDDDNGMGTTSSFQSANIMLSSGTVDLGATMFDGMSALMLQNDTLTISNVSTVNGANVLNDGMSDVGVDDRGLTTVSSGAQFLVNTSYAIDNGGAPSGGFTNDSIVIVQGPTVATGDNGLLIFSGSNENASGPGEFLADGGGIIEVAQINGGVTPSSPIDGLTIRLGNGVLDIGQFQNGATISPASLQTVGNGKPAVVFATDYNGTGTEYAEYTGNSIVYNDARGNLETVANVTLKADPGTFLPILYDSAGMNADVFLPNTSTGIFDYTSPGAAAAAGAAYTVVKIPSCFRMR